MKDNARQKVLVEDTIDLQHKIVPLINELKRDGEICFDSIYFSSVDGDYWKPSEGLRGDYLWTYFKDNPEWVISESKKIADDYQKVIDGYLERFVMDSKALFEEGKKWLFGKILLWGGSIVEDGLMSHQEIIDLVARFDSLIEEKGENFFGYAHGNIIGDHVFISEGKAPYLLGMRIVPRPGREYYDFLRSLDWLILKNEIDDEKIIFWINQYLSKYDISEVKLVFSLRCMGILGWDMLHRGDYGNGDFEKKKKTLLRFIKMEY